MDDEPRSETSSEAPVSRSSDADVDYERIRTALNDPKFIQAIAKLLFGALLTGFLAPMILTHYRSGVSQADKDRDAARDHHEKILASQQAMLDEVTHLIWNYETLAF